MKESEIQAAKEDLLEDGTEFDSVSEIRGSNRITRYTLFRAGHCNRDTGSIRRPP